MEPRFPYPGEPDKTGSVGPPPPDILNPLDRLARRPRPHMPPHCPMPFPHPHITAAHENAMSLNFAPPQRAKISPPNRSGSPVRDTSDSCNMSEQGEFASICPAMLSYSIIILQPTFKMQVA